MQTLKIHLNKLYTVNVIPSEARLNLKAMSLQFVLRNTLNTLKREDEGQKLSLRNLYGNRKSREGKRGKGGSKRVSH